MEKDELQVGDRVRLDLRARGCDGLPDLPNPHSAEGEEGYLVRLEPRGTNVLVVLEDGLLLACERKHVVRLERRERPWRRRR